MDLRLIFAILAIVVKVTFSITTIETIPPTPDNVLVTGYSGLVVRATFEKTASTYNCGWRYDGDTLPPVGGAYSERFGGLQFHIVGIGCVNRTTSRQSITCVEREIDGVTHIITNLTYLQPLTSDLILAVRCSSGADLIIALPTKTVRVAVSKDTIETIPPTPDNVLTTDYSGVMVRATYQKTTSTNNCGWRYDGDTIAPLGNRNTERFGALQFYIVGIGCVNRTTSRQSITCVEREIDGVTYITTTLTYHKPLSSDLNFAVRCNNGADLIIALTTNGSQN